MSAKTAPLGETKSADEPGAVQSPADPVVLSQFAADMVRRVSPTACNLRLVYDVPQPHGPPLTGTIPLLTMPPTLSELAADLWEKLRQVDGWINGAAWAAMVDPSLALDHTSGSFKRAVQELKDAELVQPHKQHGYRRIG